jgi:L-rhamnose mutarotase
VHEDFLFLYLESDNYDAALAVLENDPIESEWQRLLGPMLQAGGYSELAELFHIA